MKPSKTSGGEQVAVDADSTRFVRDLVERGEAAWPDRQGRLPPGATHEIVGEGANGVPIVRERRKSLF